MSWLGSSGVAPQSAIDEREVRRRLADRLARRASNGGAGFRRERRDRSGRDDALHAPVPLGLHPLASHPWRHDRPSRADKSTGRSLSETAGSWCHNPAALRHANSVAGSSNLPTLARSLGETRRGDRAKHDAERCGKTSDTCGNYFKPPSNQVMTSAATRARAALGIDHDQDDGWRTGLAQRGRQGPLMHGQAVIGKATARVDEGLDRATFRVASRRAASIARRTPRTRRGTQAPLPP